MPVFSATKDRVGEADSLLAIVIFALTIFGLVMISSASAVISHYNVGRNDFYFWNQVKSVVISFVVWGVFQSLPYYKLKKYAHYFFIASLILLAMVFTGMGAQYGTSQSWLTIPFLRSVQPAELAKIALIIYLASWLTDNSKVLADFQKGFLRFAGIVGSILLLLAAQPDFGTVLIMSLIAAAMYFVAGGQTSYLALSGVVASLAGSLVISQKQYLKNRFLAFLDPSIDPTGIGYHIKQSLIAVGSGRFWGLGFGKSRQKFEYLPEAQSDSIFAVASEELGFLRATLLISAFAFLAYKGYGIAMRAPDKFSQLLAVGITTWIVAQAFINIAVNLSLAPITGLTLPFISYGGSSLVATMIGVGILMNISKYTSGTTTTTAKPRNWRINK